MDKKRGKLGLIYKVISIVLALFITVSSVNIMPTLAYADELASDAIHEESSTTTDTIEQTDTTDGGITSGALTPDDEVDVVEDDIYDESEVVTEKAITTGTSVGTQSIVVSDGGIVVNSFSELKKAMEDGSNGITEFYLGADITSETGGILISSAKDNIVFSGTDPTTGVRHTYTEKASATKTDSIRLVANKYITLKDMNIDGKNYYGPVTNNADATANVYIKYDNIDYNGPQISFNPPGIVHYKDTRITIPGATKPGSSPSNEVAEASDVIFEGDVTIDREYNSDSTFWLYTAYKAEPELKVLSGANVVINSGSYFIYSTNAKVSVESGATLIADVKGGMTYLAQSLSRLSVDANAVFKYYHQGTYGSSRTVLVKNQINVGNNSIFDVRRTAASYSGATDTYIILSMENSASTINIDNPKRFLLVNQGSNGTGLIRFSYGGNLSIETKAINLWSTLPSMISSDIKSSDPLNGWNDSDLPSYVWNQKQLYPFSVSASYKSSSPVNNPTVSTINGYVPATDKNTDSFTSSNFLGTGSKMISIGDQQLSYSDVYANSKTIDGNTQGGAYTNTTYTDGMGDEKTSEGLASSEGSFSHNLDTGILEGTQFWGMSQNDFLRVYSGDSVKTDDGYLQFYDVPQDLEFKTTDIPGEDVVVPRADSNWSLSVQDTRAVKGNWQVYGSIETPLAASSGDNKYYLHDALTYYSETGATPFTGVDQLIYSHNISARANDGLSRSTADGITPINWSADKGPLVHLNKGAEVKANSSYSTTINWTLVDGPTE